MRPRIKVIAQRTMRETIEMLSKIYDVSFYIAQKFFNKANGVVETAKGLIITYKWHQEFALNS